MDPFLDQSFHAIYHTIINTLETLISEPPTVANDYEIKVYSGISMQEAVASITLKCLKNVMLAKFNTKT